MKPSDRVSSGQYLSLDLRRLMSSPVSDRVSLFQGSIRVHGRRSFGNVGWAHFRGGFDDSFSGRERGLMRVRRLMQAIHGQFLV